MELDWRNMSGRRLASYVFAALVAIMVGAAGRLLEWSLIDRYLLLAGTMMLVVPCLLAWMEHLPAALRVGRRADNFAAARDADIQQRNDAGIYKEYRSIQAQIYTAWVTGEFDDPSALQIAQNKALELVLSMGVRRLSYVCKHPISLVIIEDTGIAFTVARSYGNSNARIRPGMTCQHNMSLETVLDKHTHFHHVAEFQASDRIYYLVALSDVALSPTARSLTEYTAAQYQSIYQFFRVAEALAPPTSVIHDARPES
jgi:hypothetical protein